MKLNLRRKKKESLGSLSNWNRVATFIHLIANSASTQSNLSEGANLSSTLCGDYFRVDAFLLRLIILMPFNDFEVRHERKGFRNTIRNRESTSVDTVHGGSASEPRNAHCVKYSCHSILKFIFYDAQLLTLDPGRRATTRGKKLWASNVTGLKYSWRTEIYLLCWANWSGRRCGTAGRGGLAPFDRIDSMWNKMEWHVRARNKKRILKRWVKHKAEMVGYTFGREHLIGFWYAEREKKYEQTD